MFGDAGTLAAFGFLVAYDMITVAAPAYLKKIGELKRSHIVMAAVASLCLLVPTIGSFYPLPPYPIRLFPYIFVGWMPVGAVWLYVVSKRQPGILTEIEVDLERAPELDHEPIEVGDDEVSPQPVMA
jgi:amino acid transporter